MCINYKEKTVRRGVGEGGEERRGCGFLAFFNFFKVTFHIMAFVKRETKNYDARSIKVLLTRFT